MPQFVRASGFAATVVAATILVGTLIAATVVAATFIVLLAVRPAAAQAAPLSWTAGNRAVMSYSLAERRPSRVSDLLTCPSCRRD